MKTFASKILAVAVIMSAFSSKADFVYDNGTSGLASDQTNNFSLVGSAATRFGDEVVLAGSGFLSHFDYQYWGVNFSGNESNRVWLFVNDGAAVTLNNRTANEPGTVLFDSGWFGGGGMIPSTTRSTLNFDAGYDFSAGSIWLDSSQNLTLAIAFDGIESGEDFGVSLYDPPSVGTNYNSYWEFSGSSWTLMTNSSAPNEWVNFGMRIEAVPEPSMISLVLMGGLAALGFGRALGKKK
jgi:hypothetical protein